MKCLFAIMREGLTGSLPQRAVNGVLFGGTALACRARWKRERGGMEARRGSEGGVCTAAIQPSSKKLDPIHTMPAGHEGSPNDSLLGIWKWERENERGLDPQCHPSRSSAKENKRQRSQRGDFRLESPNTSLESQRFGIQSCGRARVALSHKAAM